LDFSILGRLINSDKKEHFTVSPVDEFVLFETGLKVGVKLI